MVATWSCLAFSHAPLAFYFLMNINSLNCKMVCIQASATARKHDNGFHLPNSLGRDNCSKQQNCTFSSRLCIIPENNLYTPVLDSPTEVTYAQPYQYHGTTCENHVLQAEASEMGRVESYPQLQTKAPSSPDHALLSWGEKLLPDKFRTARKPSIFLIISLGKRKFYNTASSLAIAEREKN